MKNIYLPNYKDGSIVNLMSSIGRAFGVKTPYSQLKLLPSKELKNSRNIVLIVIDGLGFEYFRKRKSFLRNYLVGPITSVFLPTTVSVITTFLTGVAPQQHAFTGWHMLLKEAGIVTKVFPDFSPRIGGSPLSEAGFEMKEILNQSSFFEKLRVKSFNIIHKDITASDFQKATSKKARILGYKNLNQFFGQIKKAISSSNRRKYIYAYWWELDSFNHAYGVNSKKANKHFEEIDKKLSRFIGSFKNSDTAFIITADHGFMNTSAKNEIKLEDHPKLKECLTFPLCGEKRVAYCYVHPSKAGEFEKYVRTKLKKYCYLSKSQDLIDRNYFGLFEPNPKLFDRVGDYILILKKNYILKDSITKDKKKKRPHIGHHAGVSKDEMLVPLIFVKT